MFQDGQSWLAKNGDIIDILVDRSIHSESLQCLAILRNLSFHPNGRAKLLSLTNFLSLLSQCLGQTTEDRRQRLGLVSIWALAANCHKAKVILARENIPMQLENLQQSGNFSPENCPLISTALSVVTL